MKIIILAGVSVIVLAASLSFAHEASRTTSERQLAEWATSAPDYTLAGDGGGDGGNSSGEGGSGTGGGGAL